MGEDDVSTSPVKHVRILWSDISHPDGRGGRFNFPSHTCPDPLIALTRRVFLSVYSATKFLLKLPDISDWHLGIFCFKYLLSKSQSLLVTHLSWDSLVFKQVKRVNNLIYIVCNFLYKDIKYVIGRKKKYILQSIGFVFPGYICFLVSFLTSQTSFEEVSSENEWLDF